MPRIPDRSTHFVIRLALHGCTNRPFFHFVVCKNRAPRNGPYVECLGSFDPMPNKYGEKLVALDMERFKYNLAKGTQMTRSVEKLLGMCNCLWLFQMSKVIVKIHFGGLYYTIVLVLTRKTEISLFQFFFYLHKIMKT
jgi:ribosomal protein S16